jgi:hypothetical protein
MTVPPDPALRRDESEIPPHDDDRPPELPDFPAELLTYARLALSAAYRLTPPGPGPGRAGVEALAFVRAAKEALQARQLAEDTMPASERAAIAAQVAALRRQVCDVEQRRATLEGQRDAVAELLHTVLAMLDADAGGGYAAKVRRKLAAIFPDAIDRQEAAEARGELGEPTAGPDARPHTGE